jgi:hypothetical protein
MFKLNEIFSDIFGMKYNKKKTNRNKAIHSSKVKKPYAKTYRNTKKRNITFRQRKQW